MSDWNPERPRRLMDLLQGLLSGDKPETLKTADEYGRAYDKLEDPATTQQRLNRENE